MKFILGAYAMSPSAKRWDKAAESAYYDGLKQIPNLRGLEFPFAGSLHAHDEPWMLATIDPSWDLVLTLIPGTMVRLNGNPRFGLASADEAGRQAALDFTRTARDAADRLNQRCGRMAVVAVEVHSAPSLAVAEAASARDRFAESLKEIMAWDWGGARIVVEHCDAFRSGHPSIKGFLSIDDEIGALRDANRSAARPGGIAVNWGRSVLETYRTETAVRHVAAARGAGLLSGLMFSGCSGAETPYGAWQDSHMPPAIDPGLTHGEPKSLLTRSEIVACMAAAEPRTLDYVGAKIAIRPDTTPPAERAAFNRDILTLLDRALWDAGVRAA